MVKNHLQETEEMRVRYLGQGDPWVGKWQTTPVFLPGKFHGQRSLEGYKVHELQRVKHD